MDTCTFKRDNFLVPITNIVWTSKNVFVVTVPLYSRKLSCELPAVDLPRGTAPVLEEIVMETVRTICRAPHKYLCQDLYSTFQRQAYGDVIFSLSNDAKELLSLQETLLRHGVARIVRPVVARLEELVAAEEQCASDFEKAPLEAVKKSVWAKNLFKLERSRIFCKVLRGRIVDVMRGDVYRVCWDKGFENDEDIQKIRQNVKNFPPMLVVLHAVRCFSPETGIGYKSLRWAQRELMYSHVEVCIHSTYPSDHDVANNTQLQSYEQLQHVRATVYLLSEDKKMRGESVGSKLVSRGLGFVIQVVDAVLSRSADFYDLLKSAKSFCCTMQRDATNNTSTTLINDLSKRIPSDESVVSESVRQRLFNFLGAEWVSGSTPLQLLWKTTMLDGDVDCNTYEYFPRVHFFRPMRTFWDMEVLVRKLLSFRGYIKSFALVRESHGELCLKNAFNQQHRFFLRVEVNAMFKNAKIQRIHKQIKPEFLGSIFFDPPEDSCFNCTTTVIVTYDRWPNVVSSTDKYAFNVSASKYVLPKHDPKNSTPLNSLDCSVELKEGETRGVLVIDLVPEKGVDTLWVVDAWLSIGTEERALSKRVVYCFYKEVNVVDIVNDVVCEENAIKAAENDTEDTVSTDSREKEDEEEGDKSVLNFDGTREDVANSDDEAHSENGGILPEVFYHSIADFYFEVDAKHVFLEGGKPNSLMEKWLEDVMYRDVLCLPVGIGVVNGCKGFVGDLLLTSKGYEEEEETDKTGCGDFVGGNYGKLFSSIINEVEKKWMQRDVDDQSGTDGNTWARIPSMIKERNQAVLNLLVRWEPRLREALINKWYVILRRICSKTPAIKTAMDFLAGNFMSTKTTDHFSVLNDNSNSDNEDVTEKTVCCVTAGEPLFWYDTGRALSADLHGITTAEGSSQDVFDGCQHGVNGLLSPSFLPSNVPLFAFSIFPRQIFAARHDQHCAHVSKNDAVDLVRHHVDWAFFRLFRPSLPNLFVSNFERLPVSMRNVEREFCDSLLHGKVHRASNSPETIYYAAERAMVAVLTALIALRLKECGRKGTTATDKISTDQEVAHRVMRSLIKEKYGELYEICTESVMNNIVLYKVYSQFFAKEGGGQDVSQKQPVLFLGLHDTFSNNVFCTPECFWPINSSAMRKAVSVLGFESLAAPLNTSSAEGPGGGGVDAVIPLLDVSGEGSHPLGIRGIGPRPLAFSTPRLYRPFPWLAVLGRPLLARDEHSPKSLWDFSEGVEEKQLVRRHVAVSYEPLERLLKTRKSYSFQSYGIFSRWSLHYLIMKRAAAYGEIKDYVSLLLLHTPPENCSEDDAGSCRFADGMLHLYGTANEPLYLYYQSRRQLRFRLGCICPSILNNLDTTSEPSDIAEMKSEKELLKQLSEAARKIIDMIAKETDKKLYSDDADAKPSTRIYLRFFTDISNVPAQNVLRIFIYPVNNDGNDKTRSNEEEPGVGIGSNPYQHFELLGNVFGQKPRCVLVVRYSYEEEMYKFGWDENWVRSSPAVNENYTKE